MAKTIKEVLEYFESLYKNGAIYVWGMNGEEINKSSIDKAYKLYKSSTYNKAYYDNKLKEGNGKIGADCSGCMCPVSGFDTNAQNYFYKCSEKGTYAEMPKNKPCLVFKGSSINAINHIGFYCGNGQVIEMRSSKDNCTKTPLSNSWKWYGIPSWIDYSSDVVEKKSTHYCVDVSKYQENINWKLVKQSGVQSCILKVMNKDGSIEQSFERNYKGAMDAGVNVLGCYNYSYATTVEKAKQDAQRVLQILNGRKMTVWLDVEDKVQQGIGMRLVEIINGFGEIISKAGYDFGVYTGMSFFNSYLKTFLPLINCKKFWIARYYNGYNKMDLNTIPNEQYNPSKSLGIDVYAWQYTSSGQVAGINGNVDINIVYDNNVQSNTVPTTYKSKDNLMKVNTLVGNLNIRTTPSMTGSIAGSYKKNELIQVFEEVGGWSKTDKGYVNSKYLTVPTGEVVGCTKLNLRSVPEVKNGTIIGQLSLGYEVFLLKDCDDWYYVRTTSDAVGYVSKNYIKIK